MPSERDCVDHLLRVAGNRHLSILEIITLGFLVARKWDRARAERARTAPFAEAGNVTAAEAAEFDRFTEQELDEFRANALRVLAEYAATLPRVGDRWSRGFWQGVAASWAYGLSLVIAALILKLAGSDVLSLLKQLFAQ